jgi:hypothetical protein
MCCTPSSRIAFATSCKSLYVATPGRVPQPCDQASTTQCTGVESSSVGSYDIVYSAMDRSLNTASKKTVSVRYQDTTAPVLSGVPAQTLKPCDTYVQPQLVARDAVDGDIKARVRVTRNLCAISFAPRPALLLPLSSRRARVVIGSPLSPSSFSLPSRLPSRSTSPPQRGPRRRRKRTERAPAVPLLPAPLRRQNLGSTAPRSARATRARTPCASPRSSRSLILLPRSSR